MATGLLALLKPVMAYINEKVQKGEMTAEQQSKLQQEMDDIRTGKAFEGPHWHGRRVA